MKYVMEKKNTQEQIKTNKRIGLTKHSKPIAKIQIMKEINTVTNLDTMKQINPINNMNTVQTIKIMNVLSSFRMQTDTDEHYHYSNVDDEYNQNGNYYSPENDQQHTQHDETTSMNLPQRKEHWKQAKVFLTYEIDRDYTDHYSIESLALPI